MTFKDLTERVLTAGAILVTGANVYAQGPIQYQTWPHFDQLMQAQRRGYEFNLSSLERGRYLAVIDRTTQKTSEIIGKDRGFRLDVVRLGCQTLNENQITKWCFPMAGYYCIKVRDNGKSIHVGDVYLNAGDILRFYKADDRTNGSVDIEDLPKMPEELKFHTKPQKKEVPTPANLKTKPQSKENYPDNVVE